MTEERRAPEKWAPWVRRGIMALLFCILLGSSGYTWVRVQQVSAVSQQITLLNSAVQRLQEDVVIQDRLNAARIDEVERILFGDVLAKLDKKTKVPPAAPAVWQRVRDQELRDRIANLEKWRQQIEQLIREIK